MVIPQNSGQGVLLPVVSFPLFVVESVESTNNSPAALEQGVTRTASLMYRVRMEERAEQERWRREMNRGEREIRTRRARERMEREAKEEVEANKWPKQQGGDYWTWVRKSS